MRRWAIPVRRFGRMGLFLGLALAAAQSPSLGFAQQDASVAVPPASLQCLARYYSVTPSQSEGHWVGRLPSGELIAYDDRGVKSLDERLDRPDLEDMVSMRYPRGPVAPVEVSDFDPGRVRVTALFAATYGWPPKDTDLATVSFFGTRVRVHRRVAAPLERVVDKLAAQVAQTPQLKAFLTGSAGGFARRSIAGTARVSPHSFGIAIDLNPARADYWQWQKGSLVRWRNRIPSSIVEAFESEGFIWGGRWYHYDTMHFEYRPELLDPSCAD